MLPSAGWAGYTKRTVVIAYRILESVRNMSDVIICCADLEIRCG